VLMLLLPYRDAWSMSVLFAELAEVREHDGS
jgi:hypothetical protein